MGLSKSSSKREAYRDTCLLQETREILNKQSSVRFSITSKSLQFPGLYIACQAPPPMEFFRQVYWNGLPFPSPGDLPNPGIEAGSLSLQVDTLLSQPPGKPKDA